MRYDVKKYLFVGLGNERDAFFKHAQAAGIIHFINTQPALHKEAPEQLLKIAHAIKILLGLPVVEQEETEDYDLTDHVTTNILSLKSKIDALQEEERITRLEISRITPFGDFSLDDINFISTNAKRIFQFYCSKRGHAEKVDLPDNVLYVNSDHGLDYFVGINKVLTQYPKLLEMHFDKSLSQLRHRLNEILKEIRAHFKELKGYAKYNTFLHHALVHSINTNNLEAAKGYVEFPMEQGDLFVIQGWVPVNKQQAVSALIEELNIHVEEIEIDAKDVPPTCLENTGAAKIGEDLVHIYDTPSMTDRDPSLWVLVFFALFFSMIIGDGGYGLILLIIALYIRHKHSGLKGVKRRMLDLFTILGFSCIVWGVLTTSFFGITVAPDHPIRHLSVMSWLAEKKAAYHIQHKDEVYQEWVTQFPDVKNVTDPQEFLLKTAKVNQYGKLNYEAYNKFSDNIIMEFALFIGVLHIIISMARYLDRNPANLGWIIFLIGGYLYTPMFLHASSIVNWAFGLNREVAAHNGLYMMYIGATLAVAIAIYKHKFFGLLEASVVIQIFGDVLSYLRLYALGLAGALLTATMNELSGTVPFVFGILILIFGHCVNIVLGIMGGVIHGLRLNFLEWYHYCFEGGGKVFNPLRKHEIE